MKVKVFQPFQKVWTPRTPDSAYDSLGITPPPSPVVIAPQVTEVINTTLALAGGTAYFAGSVVTGAAAKVGCSTRLVSGSYTS